MAYIEFRDVKKVYKTGSVNVTALDGADFYNFSWIKTGDWRKSWKNEGNLPEK